MRNWKKKHFALQLTIIIIQWIGLWPLSHWLGTVRSAWYTSGKLFITLKKLKRVMAMKNWKVIHVSVCKVHFFSNALCNHAQITSSLIPRHMWANQIIGEIKKKTTHVKSAQRRNQTSKTVIYVTQLPINSKAILKCVT